MRLLHLIIQHVLGLLQLQELYYHHVRRLIMVLVTGQIMVGLLEVQQQVLVYRVVVVQALSLETLQVVETSYIMKHLVLHLHRFL